MAKDKSQVTVDFDHHRPAHDLNIDVAYAELRHSCPVAWSEAHDGFWVVTSYDEADKVAKDYKHFSSTDGITIPPPPYGKIIPPDLDPPEHTAYRRALNPTISREVVAEELTPRIEYWTDHYLDRVIESGSCDLVYDLAVPVPASVTFEWLGWSKPEECASYGRAWHDVLSRPIGSPQFEQAAAAMPDFDVRIAEELALRREEPRGDTLSHIANMEIDGERIPDEAGVSIVRILIGAGVDTTTSLIGSALVHLHYHQDDRARLSSEPELWETAIEEFLRFYTPARNVARTCVEDIELGGCPVKAGDRMLAVISSANRDAARFPAPLRFDIDRPPSRNLSFGSGVHRCLGMHLARAEFITVMRRVLERLPDYAVVEDGLIEYARQSEVRGWTSAPATFKPGQRVDAEDESAVEKVSG